MPTPRPHDDHVEVGEHFYSVPFLLCGQRLEARAAEGTVEVFHRGKRLTSHARSYEQWKHTTKVENMSQAHQAYAERLGDRPVTDTPR